MNTTLVAVALLTGFLTGAAFAALKVPIPAPPTLSGVAGILGIYFGYKAVQWAGIGIDVLELLGI
jgi:XapX domain-containing protein